MKDDRLFKNADAQEAAYAPDDADNVEARRGNDDVPGAGVIVPAAGVAMIGANGAGGTAATGATGVPAVGPAIAGAALAGDLPTEDGGVGGADVAGLNDADAQTPSG